MEDKVGTDLVNLHGQAVGIAADTQMIAFPILNPGRALIITDMKLTAIVTATGLPVAAQFELRLGMLLAALERYALGGGAQTRPEIDFHGDEESPVFVFRNDTAAAIAAPVIAAVAGAAANTYSATVKYKIR